MCSSDLTLQSLDLFATIGGGRATDIAHHAHFTGSAAYHSDAMREVMVDPKVTSVFTTAGSPPAYLDQPEFTKFVEADAKRLIPVVRRIGRLDEKAG